MKNIIISLFAILAFVTTSYSQGVVTSRQPQTGTVRPELVWQATKSGIATDTVFSDVVALKGTLYTAVATSAADTLHRFVGYQLVTGDTCTYTLQYQDCTPEGAPFFPGTWTTIGGAIAFVPNRAVAATALVHVSTHFVRFRLIRAQGAAQAITNSLFRLFLHRY